jgi:hypothetical protein
MLTVKCQGCGAVYKLSEDLYSRKAAGFGVVVTCRRCKNEIHVEAANGAPPPAGDADGTHAAPAADPLAPSSAQTMDADEIGEEPAPLPVALVPAKATAPLPPRVSPKATAPWPAPILTPAAPSAKPSIDSWTVPDADDVVTVPTSTAGAAGPAAAAESSPKHAVPAAAPSADGSPTAPLVTPSPTEPSPAPPVTSVDARAAVRAEVPNTTARAESPKAPRVAPAATLPRPAPRAPAPKFAAKKDPVTGPFVALSPGLLGGPRPEPLRDSDAPIDSSDFIDDSNKASPKAPPVRRVGPDKAPLPKRTEGALPLKIKEPPKPPKQKPRPPVRADDGSALPGDNVGFQAESAADAEAPRLLAPDALALAAPVAEPEPVAEKPLATPTTSDDASAPQKNPGKSSRLVPVVLLALGGVGAFVLAFRSQLPSGSSAPAAEPMPAADPTATAAPPLPPPIVPADPAPTPAEPSATVAAPPPSARSETVTPAGTPAGTSATPRAPAAKGDPTSASGAETPTPASTAPAPGTPEPEAPAPAKAEGPFNADAARAALASAVTQASGCRKPGDPSGVAAVTITFSPSGRVTSATISGPPFAGTPTGGCIASTLRRARVPAFEGDMVTVRKTVEIQ